MTSDPLGDLLVDAAELDRQRIVDALKGRIAIDRSGGRIVTLTGFNALNPGQKIISFLLGRKVAVLLGVSERDGLGPTELAKMSGMPPGTVKPVLRELSKVRLVFQPSPGTYHIADHQISSAVQLLELAKSEASSPDPSGRTGLTSRRRAARTLKRSNRSANNEAEPQHSTATRSRATSNGTIPASLVRGLITEGFFDTHRTIPEVRMYLRDKKGRSIPRGTFTKIFTRLLRDHELDRERDSKGMYAYIRHSES